MTANRIKSTLPFAVVTATIVMLAGAPGAHAAEAPVKEVLASHFGSEVDTITKGNVCTVESGHKCQPAKLSSEPGGFHSPAGVAVDNDPASPQHGDVYVADTANTRVQVLTPAGVFAFMFGWDVNRTKVEKGASQTERNVCTAESKDVCQAGVKGAAAGQFGEKISGLTVDPGSGNVYVQDDFNWRVQEFTATGEFVLMLGREVNETTKGNICTAVSKDKCKAGDRGAQGGTEPSAFNFAEGCGDLLAVGGPEALLYVGDEHRVQEFEANGTYKREIPLTAISSEPGSKVTALAVDGPGDVYLVYRVNFIENAIREFDPAGKELKHFELTPREPEAPPIEIRGIALDPAGRLAVSEQERGVSPVFRGSFYEVGTTSLHLITEFTNQFPSGFNTIVGSTGITFNLKGELYAAGGEEVDAYLPSAVAELHGHPAVCAAGPEHETDATFSCSLNGEVEPWGVKETQVWFQWGRTSSLGEVTEPPVQVTNVKSPGEEEPLVKVSAPLEGLRPNETYYDQLAGFDHSVVSPESPLVSERESFKTPSVPPRIAGEPSASFVDSFSAVMFGELNPENANTEYYFEYGPCEHVEGCPGVAHTAVLASGAYGRIGATLEARGLQPGTTYHYRLTASNEAGPGRGTEGAFTTAPAALPQAMTGAASAVTTTSALVSGTVNPDGQPATYTFELGVYNGAATQYGVVFSGPAGAGSVPVAETLGLSGLQPGTTYAYRIVVKAGAGNPVQGEPVTFTTAGLPSVLVVPTPLAMLAIPNIAFPAAVNSKPPAKALTNAQKLAKALKACKKRSKKQRAACQRQARKQYGKSKQANKRKKG